MYQTHASAATILNRLVTLAAMLLSFVFMAQMVNQNTLRMAVLGIWLLICAFTSVKSLSDIISGGHSQRNKFVAMLTRWEDVMGGSGMALAVFYTITLASNAIKLAVPLVTRFL